MLANLAGFSLQLCQLYSATSESFRGEKCLILLSSLDACGRYLAQSLGGKFL